MRHKQNKVKMNFFKRYFFTTICTIAILILSLFPTQDFPPLEDVPLTDKWAHGLMYCGLMLCIWFDWIQIKLRPSFKHSFISIFYCVELGGIIELIQPFFSRSKDILDFYANCIGVIIGYLLGYAIKRYFSKVYKGSL